MLLEATIQYKTLFISSPGHNVGQRWIEQSFAAGHLHGRKGRVYLPLSDIVARLPSFLLKVYFENANLTVSCSIPGRGRVDY